MKRPLFWVLTISLAAVVLPVEAATGRVIKVLPEFLDRQGRTSPSPSLYDRDAYQALLRIHPERPSGLRFYVQWKTSGGVWQPLKLQVELRGTAEGHLPKQLVLNEPLVNKSTWFTRWTGVTLTSDQYNQLGSVTAWRVTLWEGKRLLGEQSSFLW